MQQRGSIHQKSIEIENKHRMLKYEQHETMCQKFVKLETNIAHLNITFYIIMLTGLNMTKRKLP